MSIESILAESRRLTGWIELNEKMLEADNLSELVRADLIKMNLLYKTRLLEIDKVLHPNWHR